MMKKSILKNLFILICIFFTTQIFADVKVHFIDVGQADSILIQCDGENLLLDGGNKADSSLIYSYLKKYEITNLKYVINSHPHEDHVGGLSGALNFAKANQIFSSYSEYQSKAFEDFVKNINKQGKTLEVLKSKTELSLGNGKIKVLGPIVKDDKTNNNSLVLHFVYGDVSFLFTGDMEFDEECEYIIVGSTEADPAIGKISDESPLGKALMGKKAGDIVTVQTARAEIKFEILSIA